jgi:hypothetical protein
MVDTELAYAAGLFDGEGSISLVRQKNNRSHSPQVAVASNDYEVLAWFQNASVEALSPSNLASQLTRSPMTGG